MLLGLFGNSTHANASLLLNRKPATNYLCVGKDQTQLDTSKIDTAHQKQVSENSVNKKENRYRLASMIVIIGLVIAMSSFILAVATGITYLFAVWAGLSLAAVPFTPVIAHNRPNDKRAKLAETMTYATFSPIFAGFAAAILAVFTIVLPTRFIANRFRKKEKRLDLLGNLKYKH